MRIARPILQLGGKIVEDTPKTRAGRRTVSIDAETAELLSTHRKRQQTERWEWGELYQDNDLVFAREDGSPIPPDRVTNRFKAIAAAAGLPVIRLHDGRHTAATLALEAGIDRKVVSDQLGHSTTRITEDLYSHVRKAVHDASAAKVVELLSQHPSTEQDTGS